VRQTSQGIGRTEKAERIVQSLKIKWCGIVVIILAYSYRLNP